MIIADTHIHFYPCYDTESAFHFIINNLNSVTHPDSRTPSPEPRKAVFLAERRECCFFADLRDGRIPLTDRFTVEQTPEPDAMRVVEKDRLAFYLFAGRQMATAERLEILSLASGAVIEDGLPAAETVRNVEQNNGVPVLTWALGKWLFQRKKTVLDLIHSFGPQKLLIGDSSMRPAILPQPGPMNIAEKKGFSILAGSDPLPFKGDEQFMGTYTTLIDGDIDENNPATSVRQLLKAGPKKISRAGQRSSIIAVMNRQLKL